MSSGKKKNYNFNKDQNDLLKLLKTMYKFPNEIILAVAQSQQWHPQKTINILSEMTNKCSPEDNRLLGLNSVSYDSRNQNADVVVESEISSYSRVTSNQQQRNVSPSKTGAKKKQIVNQSRQKSKKELEIDRVKSDILKGYQVLIILRGLPGSGKSTLARHLVNSTIGNDTEPHIFSTDDYFMTRNGYKRNPQLLTEAHTWNQRRVFEAAQLGISPIIVDNTNTQAWEARPYALIAVQFGYQLEVLEPTTPWFNNAQQLYLRNKHNVSKQKITEMKDRYESFDTKKLFSINNLQYFDKKPPILRKIPPFTPKPQLQNKPKRRRKRPQQTGSDFVTKPSETPDDSDDTWESDKEGTWEEIDNSKTIQNEMVADLINLNDDEENESESVLKTQIQPQFSLLDYENHEFGQLNDFRDQNFGDDQKPTSSFETFDKNELKDVNETSFSNTAYDLTRKLLNTLNKFIPQSSVESLSDKGVETVDVAVNTSSLDLITESTNDKLLYGKVRNLVNENVPTKIPLPLKLMLHKSTTTDFNELFTDFLKDESLKTNFCTLLNLFPQIGEEILADIFMKCQFDVNWTVDVLLENGIDVSYSNDNNREPKIFETLLQKSDSVEDKKSVGSNDSQTSKQKIKYKQPENEKTKEKLNELFQIPDDHYKLMPKTLELRKRKFGEGCSKDKDTFEESSTSSKDPEIDLEIEDIESETENEYVELNFGREFIVQLENEFGNTNTDYLDRLLPVMQVPKELACQLHALWMESVYCQMEMQANIIQEIERQDSELAKKLQQEETRALENENNPPPSLQEIMDMELALAIYRSDNDQWKKKPDDLATKMTKQKLYEAFPNIDKTLLCEILQAHDNSFEETAQAVLNSIGRTENEMLANINGKIVAKNALNEVAKQKDLLERTKNDNNDPDSDSDDEITQCKRGASYYREKAAHHLEMRQKLYQKANESIQKGQPQVAGYYLDVAKLHMQKYEIENNRAATAFLSEHSLGHKDQRFLDLHYLYVKEAEQALAMFLDGQISRLQQQNKQKETLFIITGRGKNSVGGKAQIKPLVQKRLRDRKLKYVEMNPGSLKVFITKHSLLTNDLKN